MESKGVIVRIVINADDPTQRGCGGKRCPFYEFASPTMLTSGVHPWCRLPGPLDGTSSKQAITTRGKGDWHNYHYTTKDGRSYVSSERIQACLEFQPPNPDSVT